MALPKKQGILSEQLIGRKMNSPLGAALLCLLTVFLAFVIAKGELLAGVGVLSALVGVPILAVCLINQRFAVTFCFILSFFIAFLYRMIGGISIPFGTIIDLLLFISFLGIVVNKLFKGDYNWSFAKSPITLVLGIMVIYQLVEAFNPNIVGDWGGYSTVIRRSVVVFLYFIVLLYCFQSERFTKLSIKIWLVLSVLLALYACWQEWVGFASFDEKWLYSSDEILNLFFIGGKFRKFSFLDNPTALGMLMAVSAIFLSTFLIGKFSGGKKAIIVVAIIFMLLAVGYSGTRTAFAMIPAGIAMLGILTINNRKTIVLMVIGLLGFLVLLYAPINNSTVLRVRSTFYPKNDASFNVRDINRASIQPYIHQNPLGGGLATAGTGGKRYYPWHRLAGFPPDSEYLRVALESGYIGLFLTMVMYGTIMLNAVSCYYNANKPQFKTFYAAIICSLFALLIGCYSQEVTRMYPNDLIMAFFFALIVSLKRLDTPHKQQLEIN